MKADLENRATYLESSSASNLPYYRKYGFEEKVDIVLERGPKPVKLNIMVREPQAVAESSSKRQGAKTVKESPKKVTVKVKEQVKGVDGVKIRVVA